MTEQGAKDTGLLILRVGIGLMFMWHGYSKLFGGHEVWAGLGGAMQNLGIDFGAPFWGFMCSFAEFFGGAFLVLGIFTRISAVMMAFTMFVAALMHLKKGDGLAGASHAIELMVVFVAIVFSGAGRFSLGRLLPGLIKILK